MEKRRAFSVAYPAVLGALSLILLWAAALSPAGKWGLTAVAGLGPCAAVASVGVPAGLLCWGGVSVLALLLVPDRLCALMFAALFGLYPVVKALAERLRRAAGWLVKLAFFNAALTLLAFFGDLLLLEGMPGLPGPLWAGIYAAANAIFFVYDLGLTRLICLYLSRADRALRRTAGR